MKNLQTVVIWIKNLSRFLFIFFIETMLVKVKMVWVWYRVLISLLIRLNCLSYCLYWYCIDTSGQVCLNPAMIQFYFSYQAILNIMKIIRSQKVHICQDLVFAKFYVLLFEVLMSNDERTGSLFAWVRSYMY